MTEPATEYALPTARSVVGDGLSLTLAASGEIRRGGLYLGLVALALVAPAGMLFLAAGDRFGSAVRSGTIPVGDPSLAILATGIMATLLVAVAGLWALSIDATLMAAALLGARASGSALSLGAAVDRSRAVFWRMVGGATIVGVAQQAVVTVVTPFLGGAENASVPAALLASLATAPFGYLATGIVLGGVGPIEALRRSVRLARARPGLAATVALFALLSTLLATAGAASGLDLVDRAATVLHPTLDSGPAGAVLVAALGAVACLALSSLVFTVGAVVVAPQVAAFLGLTHYAGGLDAVRDAWAAGRRPGFRWVTLPMLVAIALSAVLGVAALLLAG